MICSIYKITNLINRKAYIGMTVRDISIRWWEHCNSAKNGSDFFIHQAIRKYGEENFSIVVLIQTKELSFVKELEILMIEQHQTHMTKNGYNKTLGGDGATFVGRAGAIEFSTGKRLGLVDCSDKRWKTGEIISCKVGIKKTEKEKTRSSEYWKGKRRGTENGMSKGFVLFSPTGVRYEVNGRLKLFCEEMNISYSTINDHIDTGKQIPDSSKFHKSNETEKRRNTTGWSIQRK